MKTSKVFELVKAQVYGALAEIEGVTVQAKDKFICLAINSICRDRQISVVDSDRAIGIVRRRLEYCLTIEEWVSIHVPAEKTLPFVRLSAYQQEDQMQAYRHRWLDALIKEFKAKGD